MRKDAGSLTGGFPCIPSRKRTVHSRPNSGHSRRSDLRIHRIHTSGCRYIEPAPIRPTARCVIRNRRNANGSVAAVNLRQ